MQKPIEVSADMPLADLVRDLKTINVPMFDSERHQMRSRLVTQRFVLGIIEMFEELPHLPYVVYRPTPTTLELIAPPPPDDPSVAGQDYKKLSAKVKKSLQAARGVIGPQARDTLSAIHLFFNPLVSSDAGVKLQRQVFCRENLPALVDPSVQQMSPELMASLVSKALAEIAIDQRDPDAVHRPKLRM